MKPLTWPGIFRLGLVQMGLGAVVVLTTSTLNRVMVVELALPAMLPGLLVGLHYAMGLLRPRWGHGSDRGRRTPWVLGGMAVLAAGGLGAAGATTLMAHATLWGVVAAVVAFTAIGAGVGMAGTALLALLAVRTAPRRRAAAATIVWLMMIFGLAVTAATAGALLDPFSEERLLAVSAGVCAAALLLGALGVWGVEGAAPPERAATQPPLRAVLRDIWADPAARRFTVFVFVSMLAFSAQDLILEPFAGHVFGMTVGESTTLAAKQQSGIFFGMVATALLASGVGGRVFGRLSLWLIGGCLASALALAGLAQGAFVPGWPLALNVFALGFANGVFAVAAIGQMMALAGAAGGGREGARMGVWGAAQAAAFGLGGLLGATMADLARLALGDPAIAYATVFSLEAAAFLLAAVLGAGLRAREPDPARDTAANTAMVPGE